MNVDEYHNILLQMRASPDSYIDADEESIAYGLAACLIAQIMHADKPVEPILSEICKISKQVVAANHEDKPKLIVELIDFEKRLDVGIPVSLLSADTDRVKAYVFESAKLPEVRGASLFLEDLNMKEIKRNILIGKFDLPKECVIYAAGGSLLAFVPSAFAVDICQSIQELYVEKTLTATITAVSHPFSLAQIAFGLTPIQSNSSGFSELRDFMAYKLKRAKDEKQTIPFFDTPPFASRCQSCDIRPVSGAIIIDEEQVYLCPVCQRKREEHKVDKSRVLDHLKKIDSSWNGVKPAKDLKTIGKQFCDGYIGVIYADGNNIGKEMEKLTSVQEFANFAMTMLDTTEKDIPAALAKHKPRIIDKDEKGHDVEFCTVEMLLSLGSDDVLAIVPGKIALQAAIDICKAFEAGMSRHGNITMSAGIAIAPANYPVYYLEKFATQLLKSAKKKSRKLCGIATIDFQIISSQGLVASNINDYRNVALKREINETSNMVLHERPYTLERLQLLLNWARKFNDENFPLSQLYQLRTVLEESRMASSLFYLYQTSRMGKSNRKQMRNFVNDWFDCSACVPWQKQEPDFSGTISYTTPIADLLDIYNFAEGGETNGSDD